MPFLLRISVEWAALLVLWLIFVFQVTLSELLVGSAASALTVLALHRVLRTVPLCFEPRLRWLIQIGRLPRMVAADLWILLRHLVRALFRKPGDSRLELQNLNIHGNDPHASAQRALLTILLSASPNSVVLDIDHDTGAMLTHKLHSQPVPILVSKLLS